MMTFVRRIARRSMPSAIVGIMLVLLLQTGAISSGMVAQAAPSTTYNCANHCGAFQKWPGAVDGASDDMTQEHLYCNGSGCWNGSQQVGFISDETWIYDLNGNSNCTDKDSTAQCWIEAGYSTFNTGTNSYQELFWADNRPGSCSGCGSYHEHPIATLTQGFGSTGYYEISRASNTATTWSVLADGYQEYSNNNSMNPSHIYIGSELVGPSGATGAYADRVDWTYNEWKDFYTNTWNYQGAGNAGAGRGYVGGAPPPYIQCLNNNSSNCPNGGSNYGGNIQTWCCTSSGPGFSPTASAPRQSAPSSAKQSAGISAIVPRDGGSAASVPTLGTPSFTAADVTQYVTTHPVFRALTNGHPTVASIQFMPSGNVRTLDDGESTGLPDDALVCFVELHGNIMFPNLLGSMTPHTQGEDKIFEVFDAHSGNLIMLGTLR